MKNNVHCTPILSVYATRKLLAGRRAACRHASSMRTLLVIMVLVTAGLAAPVTADMTYSLTPYSGIIPVAVNNHGVVVGSNSLTFNQTPYYWSASAGSTAIPMGPGSVGVANDVNDNGLVCGWKQWISGSTGIADAWLYDTGASDFVPVADGKMSHAYALSNSSMPAIGGTYTWTNYSGNVRYYRATVYQSTGATSFISARIVDGYRVEAVNTEGYAVGRVTGSEADAFIYTPDSTFSLLPGLNDGGNEAARDINDSEHVVGYATNSDNRDRAVVWTDNGAPTNLGVLANLSSAPGVQESQANEINRWGDIVGWSHMWLEGLPRQTHAFIWRNGVMEDINDLTAAGIPTITNAYAINDLGQIATERGLLTPSYIANSSFESDLAGSWTKTTATGQVDLAADPDDAGNQVLRIATGSPVAVVQIVDTPNQPFSIEFDYRFDDLAGVLSVSLDGTEIVELIAGDTIWHHYDGLVTDPGLLGLYDAELMFTLDSASASTAFLDEVALSPSAIPEPFTLSLLTMGAMAMLRRKSVA
jgi:probable HAF family extracellular repeat protein